MIRFTKSKLPATRTATIIAAHNTNAPIVPQTHVPVECPDLDRSRRVSSVTYKTSFLKKNWSYTVLFNLMEVILYAGTFLIHIFHVILTCF